MKPLLYKYIRLVSGVCHLAAVLFCIISSCYSLTAQDIMLKNPSLEGIPGQGNVPSSWRGRNTPDIQPGVLNIIQPPSDGATYIGLHSGPSWPESISQELPLLEGRSYTMSLDLAYAPTYAFQACYANLTIYGGNTPSDTTERLWSSGLFYHTNWKRYTFVFQPSHSWKYLTLMADATVPCDKSIYGAALLVDHLSESLRETPQLKLTLKHTCKGDSTGDALVKVEGVTQRCSIRWSPGGDTTNHLTKLPAGDYTVTVTHPNGTSVTASVTIIGWEVKSNVVVTPSPCYGDDDNTITLSTSGGTPPYRYYLSGTHGGTYTPVFKALKPGNYSMLVKDEEGCQEQLARIPVVEPGPVVITDVRTKDVSCNTTMDGKIQLEVSGGTRPYAYSLDNAGWQTDSVWSGLNQGVFYFQVQDAHHCSTGGSQEIIRNMRECAVFVPTAFTPNNDGKNDFFHAIVYDDVHHFQMQVYNRWGKLVFSTTDPAGMWNGEQRGQLLPAGAYIWVLTYTDSKQQARKQTGTVILVR
ncbi:gliding motility-associated C-terminal domain-containing protein [Chitinophaga sp. 30R24]|uniref:T9SS type B sorting domain-containing protein n=1 Tax=Chitinophaga sp. 30R24 TaxID=3248838 RepID=UPI003B90EE22